MDGDTAPLLGTVFVCRLQSAIFHSRCHCLAKTKTGQLDMGLVPRLLARRGCRTPLLWALLHPADSAARNFIRRRSERVPEAASDEAYSREKISRGPSAAAHDFQLLSLPGTHHRLCVGHDHR